MSRIRGALLAPLRRVPRSELPLFACLAALALGINLVDGLLDVLAVAKFMASIGVDGLPYLAIAEGVLFIAVSSMFTLLVDRWPKPRLMLALLAAYALSLLAIRTALAAGADGAAVYPLLYLLRFQMSTLLLLVGAALTADAYNMAGAARVVPLLGVTAMAGRVGGAKLGGGSGAALTTAGLQPEELITFVAAFLLLGSLAWWAAVRWGPALAAAGGARGSRPGLRDTLEQAPRFVARTRLFAILALVSFVSAVGFRVTTFQFLSLGRSTYAEDLGFQAFYGDMKALMQVVIFVLQLTLAGRLLRHGGVAVALLAVPVHFIAGGLLFLLAPGLWPAVLLLLVNGAIFLVFERPSLDVLLPVVPQQVRGRVATLMKTFVGPAGWMLGGVVLLVVTRLGAWQDDTLTRVLGSLLIGCGALCLPPLLLLRRNYGTYLLDWRLARRRRLGWAAGRLSFDADPVPASTRR